MSVCLFFRRKTAYEMRISDWSSDVCSSDLVPERHPLGCDAHPKYLGPRYGLSSCPILGVGGSTSPSSSMTGAEIAAMRSRWMRFHADRKSVVSGESVSVRVVLGGRRIIQKNKYHSTYG